MNKYEWSKGTFRSIDWNALKLAYASKRDIHKVTITKLIHKWQSTNVYGALLQSARFANARMNNCIIWGVSRTSLWRRGHLRGNGFVTIWGHIKKKELYYRTYGLVSKIGSIKTLKATYRIWVNCVVKNMRPYVGLMSNRILLGGIISSSVESRGSGTGCFLYGSRIVQSRRGELQRLVGSW